MSAQMFYVLAILLMAASFVTNGGWGGNRFAKWQNYAAADRFLFLSWAMLAARNAI